MSSAFGDFGPLTERRRAELARQKRRRLLIAGGTVSIVIVLIVLGGAAVMYSEKKGSHESHHSTASHRGSPPGHVSPPPDDGELKGVSKSVTAMCVQTDFKGACERSLGKAVNDSASSPRDVIRAAVKVVGDAIAQAYEHAGKIDSPNHLVKGAIADCKEFSELAKADLNRTLGGLDGADGLTKEGYQMSIWLSAVIAHQETCVDGFPHGEFKGKVKDSFVNGKELASNALAFIEKGSTLLSSLPARRLFAETEEGEELVPMKNGVPVWVSSDDRRALSGAEATKDLKADVVVAKDGSGKFKTINEALSGIPETHDGRYVIQVKEGEYDEQVTITRKMVNVTMFGDGGKKTIVTGKKSFADSLTTFKTATFTVQGDGFMAIDMGFQNTAGPEKHQAVALLVQSDKSIFLNCRMEGFMYTLYAHSGAQFYRNCAISGTVDFIFGDAAAVFQRCNITLRRPLDTQHNTVTAQGRADGRESTGFVLQKCDFAADDALKDKGKPPIKSYLGTPWRDFSRLVVMESEIPDFIDKAGYTPWNGDAGLKTLWYGEYANKGPGADTAGRVAWEGYKKVISKDDAAKFTVENFLHAKPWIDPTGAPVKYSFMD